MLSYIIVSLFITVCLFLCTFTYYKHIVDTANIVISQHNTELSIKKLTIIVKASLIERINKMKRMKMRYAKFLIFGWIVMLIGWAIITKIYIF